MAARLKIRSKRTFYMEKRVSFILQDDFLVLIQKENGYTGTYISIQTTEKTT